MPGFNQRGPMNEGPMTGRKMGRCAAQSGRDVGEAPDLTWNAPGFGRNRGMPMGRGRCQRTYWDRPAAGDIRARSISAPHREIELAQKVQQLEMEIETLKNELKHNQ